MKTEDALLMETPPAIYRRRLEQIRQRLARGNTWDGRLGYSKLIFAAAALLALFGLRHVAPLAPFALAAAVIFLALAIGHERVLKAQRRGERAAAFYERGLARLEDRWAGKGLSGESYLDPAHPYARDLDLFGSGSLFELLCTARTRAGEAALAAWLLHPASPEEVRARQAAAAELGGRLDFRERLGAAGERLRAEVSPDALTAWGEHAGIFRPARAWALALALLMLAWLAAVALGLARHHWLPLLLISILNLGLSRWLNRRVHAAAAAVESLAPEFKPLEQVLARMEREEFSAPRLRALQTALLEGSSPASVALRRLRRRAESLEARRNLFVQPFSPFIFYAAQWTLAVERWRQAHGRALRGWLAAVGEMEALAAIGGYAWEHPGHAQPEFCAARPLLEAEELAHPLLPAGKAVGNDLRLDAEHRLLIVSGPNMAGKSTFLRGIGLNVVLAQCGAPVRARRLRLSPLAVGASICVLDSLQGGISRFYAEIQRLKLLADLAAGPLPLLFLLDELLSGTNSHDRYEGTRFIARALLGRGAVGLITTHDLALTRLPLEMPEARNGHFEDQIVAGRLSFDYRLKPGVVRSSNALQLMRAVGLELGNG